MKSRVYSFRRGICALFYGAMITGWTASANAQQFGFGASVIGGNFNGAQESYSASDELVIGSPWESSSAPPYSAGAVFVYVNNGGAAWTVGSPIFKPASWDVFKIQQSYFGAGDGGTEESDLFGSVLAVGDFNGDGKKDLAFGVPGEDLSNKPDAGCVHVLFGASNAGTRWPFKYKSYLTRSNTFATDGLLSVPGANDRFGAALAAGDFNGDGVDDLAVGAPGVTINGKGNAGAVFVFNGSGSSPPGSGTFSSSFEWTFTPGGVYSGSATGPAQIGEFFGISLAVGNFNSDLLNGKPLMDLAIGGPGAKVGTQESAGRVVVFYGSSLHLNNNSSRPPQIWSQANVPGSYVEAYDNFGMTLAAGNFNRHGSTAEDATKSFDDLAIGTPWEDLTLPSGSYTDGGLVQVVYGYKSGLQIAQAPSTDPDREYSHASQMFHHESFTGITTSPQNDARFGAALATGDVLNQNGGCQGNSCNPADLIIGEIGYNSWKGEVFIVDGTGTGGLAVDSWRVVAPEQTYPSAQFGSALSVLKFGLGYNQPNNSAGALAQDLFVGAPNVPRTYLYYGRAPSDFFAGNISYFSYPSGFLTPPP